MSTGIVTGPLADLALYVHELERRATTAERELEEQRQEAGRLRARVEELEAAARKAQSDHCGCLGYIAEVGRG